MINSRENILLGYSLHLLIIPFSLLLFATKPLKFLRNFKISVFPGLFLFFSFFPLVMKGRSVWMPSYSFHSNPSRALCIWGLVLAVEMDQRSDDASKDHDCSQHEGKGGRWINRGHL
eukprot:TRINITY_DN3607_c0_g4_i1.p1 TRINITY_DN3607_c0_g4~~TRINITY_DN3607_c0_g4_i1.p1  ORF type:complete len:117 (-),score=16.53 TRINITY_DN3607_c0_g4_i1:157-507(-)